MNEAADTPRRSEPLLHVVLAVAIGFDLAIAPLLAMVLVASGVLRGSAAVAAAVLSTLPFSLPISLAVVYKIFPGLPPLRWRRRAPHRSRRLERDDVELELVADVPPGAAR